MISVFHMVNVMHLKFDDIASELINEVDGLIGCMLISIDGTIKEYKFANKHTPNLENYGAMVAATYNISNNCSQLSGQGKAHVFIWMADSGCCVSVNLDEKTILFALSNMLPSMGKLFVVAKSIAKKYANGHDNNSNN